MVLKHYPVECKGHLASMRSPTCFGPSRKVLQCQGRETRRIRYPGFARSYLVGIRYTCCSARMKSDMEIESASTARLRLQTSGDDSCFNAD